MPKLHISLLALSVFALPTLAHAQSERCSDILVDGTKKYESFQQSAYFQQIAYSRFMSSSFQQSSKDGSGAFTVPVGKVVMGGNYSEQTHRQKQAMLQRTNFSQLTASQELAVALMSGDGEIVGAWKDCMAKRTGLAMHFERTIGAPKQVILHMVWYPTPGVPTVELSEDIALPSGVTVMGSGRCLKKGTVLTAVTDCPVQLELQSASQTMQVLAITGFGSATAFLPARIKLKRDPKKYTIALDPASLRFRLQPKSDQSRIVTFGLAQSDIDEGYLFDQSTIRLGREITYGGGLGGHCRMASPVSDGYQISSSLQIASSNNASLICRVVMSAMLMRDTFVPEDAE